MDLISRKALLNHLNDVWLTNTPNGSYDMQAAKAEGIAIAMKAVEDFRTVPAVPLVTLLKFIEQTEHFTYPPCQNEIEKCRDCKLHYIFGSQKECWKQFLTKWMEEQDAAD